MTCTSTVVITHDHLIHAQIETADRRLLEVVNERSTCFLRLKTADIYRHRSNTLVTRVDNAIIPKSSLALIAPATGRHEAAQKRRDNFTAKKVFETFLIVLGFEIHGSVHLSGSGDPVAALTTELTGFFPVPDARIRFPGGSDVTRSSVIIVNSAFISLLQIGNSTAPPNNNRNVQSTTVS